MRIWLAVLMAFCAVLSSAGALEISTNRDEYHLGEDIVMHINGTNDTTSVEVQDPFGSPILIMSDDPIYGSFDLSFNIGKRVPDDYEVFASSKLENATSSFSLIAPDFKPISVGVTLDPRPGRPGVISVLVKNEGNSGSKGWVECTIYNEGDYEKLKGKTITLDNGTYGTAEFSWEPKSYGLYNLSIYVSSSEHIEWDESDNGMDVGYNMAKSGRGGGGPNELVPATTLYLSFFMVVLVIGGALVVSENNRYRYFSILAPLYHRIGKDHLFTNEVRGMIYGYILANPGSNYSSIKRALDLPNGTLAYHLKVLARTNHVISLKDGSRRRFYTKFKGQVRTREHRFSRTELKLIDMVQMYPGIRQKELARNLELTQGAISYNLNKLQGMNVIKGLGKKNIRYVLNPGKVDYVCTVCGNEFSTEDANFCPKCGTKMGPLD